jgi:retron-type reverse transcriptase
MSIDYCKAEAPIIVEKSLGFWPGRSGHQFCMEVKKLR